MVFANIQFFLIDNGWLLVKLFIDAWWGKEVIEMGVNKTREKKVNK
jgi:hypothetical protein